MEDFTFSTLEYTRPDFEGMAAFAAETKERIERAGSYAEVKEAMLAYEERGKVFSTDATIASIRHTLDTTDEFYEKENEYIDAVYPTILPQLLAVD
ncbi:MAG: M3 family oligoendopeptidase, partial [Lachnospiraceae bacterium]|nr:M3 family oligoendopeptidase [Lachnospiraceae bacterium]